jgi:hypothetical protein
MEDYPSYIKEKKENVKILGDSSFSISYTIDEKSAREIPGGWIYNIHAETKLKLLRIFHFIGYSLQLSSYLFSEIWISVDYSYSSSPLAVDPIFSGIGWGSICILGGILLPVLFKNSKHSISLLTEKLVWLYYPIYFLLVIMFPTRHFSSKNILYGISTTLLGLILFFSLTIYLKFYRMVQNHKMTWMQYFGGNVLISVLCSFVFLDFIRTVIEIIFVSSSQQNLLGWERENWLILVLTLVFGVGIAFLTRFQDFWFPGVISFYYFGIYSCQKRFICKYDEHTCSENVQITTLALGSMIISFIILVTIHKIYKKPDLIYSN